MKNPQSPSRVLVVHNRYQIRGGEDTVFEAETKLLRAHGILVDTLEFDNEGLKGWKNIAIGALRTLYNRQSSRALTEKIREFQPDLIHVHNFFPTASPAIFYAARKHKVPVVVTLHNYRLICPSATLFYKGKLYLDSIHRIFPLKAVFRGIYRDSFFATLMLTLMTGAHKLIGTFRQQVDGYIVLTAFAKHLFENSSLGAPGNKFHVKPNFVFPAPASEVEAGDRYLYVGRLSEEKGIRVLLDAMSGLEVGLDIIGTGPLEAEVLAAQAGNPRIAYLGSMPNEEIRKRMQTARALIFPSVWFEGMPMTIIEAFSAATPVIASNLGAMASMIRHKENGLHFEAGSPESLMSQIEHFEAFPDLRKHLGDAALKDYLTFYSPEQNFRQLCDIYSTFFLNFSSG